MKAIVLFPSLALAVSAQASELVLSNRLGRVVISDVGAQVLSYVPAGRQELLFMPADADFSKDREMHGGIPVCWPWFGRMGAPGSRLHGLARYRRWRVAEKTNGPESSRLVLTLASDDATRKVWPYDFRLVYTIELTDRLSLALAAENTGVHSFKTTLGFHPYFRVRDPAEVVVDGLKKPLRAYPGIDGGHETVSGGTYSFGTGYGRVEVSAVGERKLVVWNPGPDWKDWSPDGNLAKEDWRRFLCVEPAVVGPENAVRLETGGRHVFKMTVRGISGTGKPCVK